MKKKLAISLLFFSFSSSAWCVCQVPRPRLVCAEYSQSKAVVIAKLIGVTSDSKEYPSYFVYKFAVVKRLRGRVPYSFELYEGNDSGRASFNWRLNKQYLLFLIQADPSTHYQWTIDGCGNSAPLSDAGATLRQIAHISSTDQDGVITGFVSTDSWTTGVPGATLAISGDRRTFETKTDANGRFSKVVPVGTYSITATKNGKPIPIEPFTYENPAHVVIAPGGCAQVQFSGSRGLKR